MPKTIANDRARINRDAVRHTRDLRRSLLNAMLVHAEDHGLWQDRAYLITLLESVHDGIYDAVEDPNAALSRRGAGFTA